ncbi:LuxR C-terminal-related transcriptional regulator [Pseudonocardia hispaniensis]|uniref:LuxR C-terminal-related transcriptional regulator n=1 Tax=Pseudonocardia hispaniensis TaxID=904933 RepID=A0ABW1J103_9PSEU
MDRERRRHAKREIVSLCHSGLTVDDLYHTTLQVFGTLVPYDRACWHTVDPATMLFTTSAQRNLGHEPRLPVYEYEIPDVNKWTYLSRQPWPVGVLGHATRGNPDQSPRYRDLLRPRGVAHEIRASLVSDHRCWGFVGLYRDRGRDDFTEDDAALLAELDAHLAAGIRRALLLGAASAQPPGSQAPGVLILGSTGEISSMNAAAEELLAVLADAGDATPPEAPHAVLAVACQARRMASGEDATPAWSRARTVTGQWIALHGTRLGNGPDAATAVIIEPARPLELADLIVLAYGLTPREREVTRLVIVGRSTADIAQVLHLSPFTVQDYLKSVFEKVGVRSRRELVATVFRENYWPRILAGDRIGGDGFFPDDHAVARSGPA